VKLRIAAVLSGPERYLALDLVRHTELQHNLHALDELLNLFIARADIPDNREFPDVKSCLDAYDFPATVLPTELEPQAMLLERSRRIQSCLAREATEDVIAYVASWLHVASDRFQVSWRGIDLERPLDIASAGMADRPGTKAVLDKSAAGLDPPAPDLRSRFRDRARAALSS